MRFGPRYAAALTVDAIGAGLLRPFLVVYGLSVLHLPAAATGLALSAGLLAGLLAVPLTGRWIDAGGRPFTSRVLPVVATLLVRVAGVAVLLAAPSAAGLKVVAFGVASLLLGIGNQVWPPAHAALVAALAAPEPADAPLAAARSLRNAGLGAGALIAALAVAGGPDVLRVLAVGTAAGYAAAAALVLTVQLPPAARSRQANSAPPVVAPVRHGRVPGMAVLLWANLPFALCFAVLEVAIPVVLTGRLGASPAWSAILFAGNTVLVVALQVYLVVRLKDRSRRAVLAASGVVLAASYLGFWGSPNVAVICVVAVGYTLGEILYAGSGTALVTAAAPPHRLGHALARWQLSTGLANAAAPALLLALLAASPALLWSLLAGTTLLGAFAVHRWAPEPERHGGVSQLSGRVGGQAGSYARLGRSQRSISATGRPRRVA
ncbi:MFS transporter [Dactylosporangium sp. NPDC049525]|uniref:MFS transporter n=1 Tax=Dactylosporangium sp. NPDC049525 TaxID=3154730 RepID=UPI003441922F